MLELFETNPNVVVPEAEYQRLLGYPRKFVMTGRARELADAARNWFSENGRPWFYAREVGEIQLANGGLSIGGVEFSSQRLHDLFAESGARSAMLAAVSAGGECEGKARELWQAEKPDEYFFLETFGSAVAEHLIALASGSICAWADRLGTAALPHHGPGYSGWHVSDQNKLWNLIRANRATDLDGRLGVLESGMLRPKKSLLAVIGLTRDLENARRFVRLTACETCSLAGCKYRRAPQANWVNHFETVHRKD